MEFKRRVDQQTRKKIGMGVKTFYDKKGRKDKPKSSTKLAIGAGVVGGAALIALAKSKKNSPFLGSARNPYVQQALRPVLPNKISKSTNQARRGFTDTLGRVFKKGRFLPKGVSDIGLVQKAKKPISITKQVGNSQETLSKLAVDASNREASDKWITIDTQAKQFSMKPYTVNFNKVEVDSYVTKEGKKVRSFKRKQKPKKHLLDDKVVLDRYVAQSRVFDKRITADNAKEVFDAEDRGNKIGKQISTVATPFALYGLGKFALSRNKNAKALFETKIAATNKTIDKITDAAQKGSYAANLNRVHKLGLEMNSLGELGQKGVSKKARAYMIGQRARVTNKAISLTGKAVKSLNKFNTVADVGVDVLAGPTQYKTRTINTKQGPVQMTLPTLGSTVKRQVIPGLVIGVPIAVVTQKVAKDRYFKNKEKSKNETSKSAN
jgi:hypothetical protein